MHSTLKSKFLQLYFDFLTIFRSFSSSLQRGSSSTCCGPIYINQGVQGDVLACTAPSQCKFLQLYFDFLTIFRRFSSSLQRGSLLACCGPIYMNQEVQDDVLACTAPSKCKFLLIYFYFLTIFRRFSTSLQRGSPSPQFVGIQITHSGMPSTPFSTQ